MHSRPHLPILLVAEVGTETVGSAETVLKYGGRRLVSDENRVDASFPTVEGAVRTAFVLAASRSRVALHDPGAEGTPEGLDHARRLLNFATEGQIVVSESASAEAGRAEGVLLHDLGPHLLPGSRILERIALLSLLPNEETEPLYGRSDAIDRIDALLHETRFLTLVGEGGTGKTRLARYMAGHLRDRHPDGTWLIEVAARRGKTTVAQAIASALEVRELPGASIEASLVESLRPRKALLVLDECESTLDEASHLAETLVGSCPNLTILATSRRPLGATGEVAFPLEPLTVPQDAGPERLGDYDSVRLFLDRIADRAPDFALDARNSGPVAQVCQTLRGSPLALEIAAARVPTMTVERVATSILAHDASLEGLIGWSYDLLEPTERALLRAASVFGGGMMPEAVAAVARVSIPALDEATAQSLLRALTERSLLRPGKAGRYRMLETVRQFAWSRAERSGELTDFQSAHASFFDRWTTGTSRDLFGPRQIEAADRLELERDNLRAAHAHFVRGADAAPAQRLVARLATFWEMRGVMGEGVGLGFEALALGPTPARLGALVGTARLLFLKSEPQALELYQEALQTARVQEDLAAEADAEQGIGNVVFWRRDIRTAEAHFQEAYALRQELDDPAGIAACLHSLGNVRLRDSRFAEAEGLFERALAMRREIGDYRGIAMSLGALSQVAASRDDDETVVRLTREVVRLLPDLHLRWALALNLTGLMRVLERRGELRRAAQLAGARARVRETTGFPVPEAERADLEASLAVLREACGPAEYDAAYAEGYARDWDGALALALQV